MSDADRRPVDPSDDEETLPMEDMPPADPGGGREAARTPPPGRHDPSEPWPAIAHDPTEPLPPNARPVPDEQGSAPPAPPQRSSAEPGREAPPIAPPEAARPPAAAIPVEPAPPPSGTAAPSRLRRAARRVARALVLLLVGFFVLCMLLLVVYRFVQPPTTGVQAQRRVEALFTGGDYSKERRHVALEDISTHLPRAVVAAEDGRFWDHDGFDFEQMGIALDEAVGGGRMRGASTITQQLVKNLFGCACRNPVRKVYDFALTPPAELILGKERILEIYLNQVEWGPGIYGAEAAARHHYGVGAADLSRTQAAGLAALLPNPLGRTPGNTGGYRREILRRMGQRGW